MGGLGSRSNRIIISSKQQQNILKQLEEGKTYKLLSDQYGVPCQTVRNLTLRLGKPTNWKTLINNKDFKEKEEMVLKRLAKLPNVEKALREFGLNKSKLNRKGIKLSKTKEYLMSKSKILNNATCNICAVNLKGYRWHKFRLCKKCGDTKNKVRLKNYSKKRYHTDPKFRKIVLARNAEWRKKRRTKKNKYAL
jgi:hypothetical protein